MNVCRPVEDIGKDFTLVIFKIKLLQDNENFYVRHHSPNPVIGVQANTLKKQIEDFLDKEETMRCQCSRMRDNMSRAYTRPTPFNQVYP